MNPILAAALIALPPVTMPLRCPAPKALENHAPVRLPMPEISLIGSMKLSASAPADPAAAKPEKAAPTLDRVFDGRKLPVVKPVPAFEVRRSQRFTLPEDDLMSELGLR